MISDISTILCIITSILLAISESLPMLNYNANGILHFFILFFQNLNKNLSENEPLLPISETNENVKNNETNDNETKDNQTNDNEVNKNNNFDELFSNIIQIQSNIYDISTKIQSSLDNGFNDFNTARQIKILNSELYELNFISNYIKSNYMTKSLSLQYLSKNNKQLLISEGYIVDYDSIKNTYTIKW
jgi:hypothetical protein